MNDIKLLISSLLIICSFFLGYGFAVTQESLHSEKEEQKNTYVNVESKWKKIVIDSDNPDVILLLNGQETSSWSIVIE